MPTDHDGPGGLGAGDGVGLGVGAWTWIERAQSSPATVRTAMTEARSAVGPGPQWTARAGRSLNDALATIKRAEWLSPMESTWGFRRRSRRSVSRSRPGTGPRVRAGAHRGVDGHSEAAWPNTWTPRRPTRSTPGHSATSASTSGLTTHGRPRSSPAGPRASNSPRRWMSGATLRRLDLSGRKDRKALETAGRRCASRRRG